LRITNLLLILTVSTFLLSGALISIAGISSEYGVTFGDNNLTSLNKTQEHIETITTISDQLSGADIESGFTILTVPSALLSLAKSLVSLGNDFTSFVSGMLIETGYISGWAISLIGAVLLIIVSASVWNSLTSKEKS